jgi:hypothetical protein
MLKTSLKIMEFVNENILKNSKEDSIKKGDTFQILLTTAIHNLKFKMGV